MAGGSRRRTTRPKRHAALPLPDHRAGRDPVGVGAVGAAEPRPAQPVRVARAPIRQPRSLPRRSERWLRTTANGDSSSASCFDNDEPEMTPPVLPVAGPAMFARARRSGTGPHHLIRTRHDGCSGTLARRRHMAETMSQSSSRINEVDQPGAPSRPDRRRVLLALGGEAADESGRHDVPP